MFPGLRKPSTAGAYGTHFPTWRRDPGSTTGAGKKSGSLIRRHNPVNRKNFKVRKENSHTSVDHCQGARVVATVEGADRQYPALRTTARQGLGVKEVYGISGSTGCTVRCEVPNLQEADRLVGLIQVSGLPNVEMITLIPAEQWVVGLEEFEKQAAAVPASLEGTAVS